MNLNNAFSQSSFDSYATYLKGTSLSDASVKRKLSSLNSFQKFLIKKKLIVSTEASSYSYGSTHLESSVKNPVSKSFLRRYIIIAVLLILFSALGYGLYTQVILKANKNLAYSSASNPVRPGRILSFQGRLTDSSSNPITSSTPIIFRLLNASVGGTELYTSSIGNSQAVTPDENGIFSVVIGKTHGTEIPATVFSENDQVWLEIIGGGETMTPRQQIATVAYALNAETLQGLPPSASGYKDTVLVIDGSGNLNLGETSPTITSSSGTLGIIGQAMLIGTSTGTGGNITIAPDGNGIIKLTGSTVGSTAVNGFVDLTDANLNTGNLVGGAINNTNRGYNFINFTNYNTGTTLSASRFSVDAYGNTTIGGTATANNLNVSNSVIFSGLAIGTTGSGTTAVFINASGTLSKNVLGALAFQDSTPGTTYTATNGLNLSGTVFGLGGTLTQNTNIGISSFGLSFLGLGNTQSLYLASSGSVGIGTTAPGRKLEISGAASTNPGMRLSYSTNPTGYYGELIQETRGGTGGFRYNFNVVDASASTNLTALTIEKTGFVGIGTTGPGAKLDIVRNSGTNDTTPLLRVKDLGLDYTSIQIDGNGVYRSATTRYALGGTDNWFTGIVYADGGSASAYSIATTNSLANSKLLITNTGNVGIGTTNPTGLLTTYGLGANTSLTGSTTGQMHILQSTANDATLRSSAITFGQNGVQSQNAVAVVGSLINSSGSNLYFGTSNSFGSGVNNTALFIKNDGSVGIGTTLPLYKLHISGDALISTRLGIGSTNTSYTLNVGGSGLGVGGTVNFSGLAIGTTGTGTSGVFIAANGNLYKNKFGALAFADSTISTYNWIANASSNQTISGGTTLSFTGTNGLTTTSVGTSQITFGLGGTLTGNTNIGTSSFNLSFLGLGNTQSLYLASSGNVGIGTTGPEGTLHVHTGTAGTVTADVNADNLIVENLTHAGISILSPDANQSAIYFGSPSDNIGAQIAWTHNDDLFTIGTHNASADLTFTSGAGTRQMTILDTGNVGIGTTSPARKLTVADVTATNDAEKIMQLISVGDDGTLGPLLLQIGAKPSATGANRYSFINTGDSGAWRNLVLQQSGGNVGIGTTGPTVKLQVAGGSIRVGTPTTGDVNPYIDLYSTINVGKIQAVNGHLSLGNAGGTEEAVTILTSGNVGIGTTNPNLLLHVYSPTSDTLARFQSGDPIARIILEDNTGAAFIEGIGTNINFPSGNVGIGTTGPSSRLHILSSTAGTGDRNAVVGDLLVSNSTAQAADVGAMLKFDQKYTDAGAYADDVAGIRSYKMNSTTGDYGFGLKFETRANGSTIGTKMTIDSTGNVGIGTTSPGAILDVVKSQNGQTLAYVRNTNAGIAALSGWYLDNDGASGTGGIMVGGSGYTGVASWQDSLVLDSDSGLTGGIKLRAATGGIKFSASATEANDMFINSSGNVGIGTTDPHSKLEVMGPSGGGAAVIQLTQGLDAVGRVGTLLFTHANGTDDLAKIVAYRVAAGDSPTELQFWTRTDTASVQRMVINKSGNVGIGTTNPGRLLELSAANPILRITRTVNSNAGWAEFYTGTTQDWLLGERDTTDSNFHLYSLGTGADAITVLRANGNVGIGTTAPLYDLHVNGDTLIATRLGIGSTNTSYTLNVGGSGLGVGGTVNFSGLAIGTTGTGTSGVFVDGSGNLYKNKFGALAFADSTPGTTGATNGLSLIGGNIGLGGTLTQNTNIGTSSFNLSFLGLGNTQSLYIASNGNVGIGTTGPGRKLVVQSASDASIGLVYTGAGNGALFSKDSSGNLNIYADEGGTAKDTIFHKWGTASSEVMRITNTGNVGIGTTDPKQKLEIAATGASAALSLWDMDITGAAFGKTRLYQDGDTLYLKTIYANNESSTGSLASFGASAIALSQNTTIANGKYLATDTVRAIGSSGLALYDDASNGIFVKDGGNVGIGTTAPQEKLTIKGNMHLTENQEIIWSQDSISPATYSYARIKGIRTNSGGSQEGYLSFYTKLLAGSLTERMRIDETGNVGIGTTSPGAKLEIYDGTSNSILFYPGTPQYGIRLKRATAGGWANTGYGFLGGSGTDLGGFGAYGNGDALIRYYIGTFSSDEKITILTGGQVGIGEVAPGAKLSVSGGLAVGSSYDTTVVADGNAIISGNVGIGTTGPTSQLHLYKNQADTTFSMDSSTGYAFKITNRYSSANQLTINGIIGMGSILDVNNSTIGSDYTLVLGGTGTGNSNSLALRTHNAIRMVVSDGGNVGIGTTNPLYKLHVSGDALISTRLGIGSTNSTYGLFVSANGIGVSGTSVFGGNLSIGGTLTLSASTVVGSGTTALFIDPSTNVITRRALGDLAFQNNASLGWIAQASANQTIGTGTTLHFDGTNGLTTTSVGTSQITFGLGGTLTANTNIGVSSFGLNIIGVNSNTQAFYIKSNGSVGIGTSAPSYKLHVAGEIFTSTKIGIGATHGTYNLFVNSGGVGVTGDSVFSNNLSVGSTLTVTGRSVFTGGFDSNTASNITSLTLDGNNGTALTISGTSFTTDISLQNNETIDNNTDGTINFTSTNLSIGNTTFLASNGRFYGNGAALREADANILDSSTWDIGTSGSQTGFSQNGASLENVIQLGTGPYADEEVPLWVAGSQDTASDAEGGWNTSTFAINPEKSYRYTVWMQKTVDNNGTSYFGTAGTVKVLSTGATNGNPYFWTGDLPQLSKWYLLVGYVHPWDTASTTNLGGIYDPTSGQKVVGLTDYKFNSSTDTTSYHRAYLYYDTTVDTNKQYMYAPRVDVLDGKEPTINSLLITDPATATNGLSFIDSNSIGLGGTLTQNTNIGTSSFGLSFLGLGNSQALYIASSGYVGIGTTAPGGLLHVKAATSNHANVYIEGGSGGYGGNLNLKANSIGSGTDYAGNVVFDMAGTVIGKIQGHRMAADATSGYLEFSTANSGTLGTRMTIDNLGNVGIGTTAPTALLQVNSAAGSQPTIKLSDADHTNPFTTLDADTHSIGSITANGSTTGGLYVSGYGNGVNAPGIAFAGYVGSADPTDTTVGVGFQAAKLSGTTGVNMGALETAFQFGGFNNVTKYMTILGSGNVGIGTTGPQGLLSLYDATDGGDPELLLYNASTTNGAVRDNLGSIWFGSAESSGYRVSGIRGFSEADFDSGTTSSALGFYTTPSGTATALERLTITNAGNVGIGTTAPTAGYRLDVSAASAGQIIKSTTGTNYAYLTLNNTAGDFVIGREQSTGGGIMPGSSPYAGFIYAVGAYPLQLGNNGTTAMTINSGNVGIGTTSPRAKLDVVGDIVQEWSDTSFIGMQYQTGTDYRLGIQPNAAQRSLSVQTLSADSAAFIAFKTGTIASPSEKMRITYGGNVGIGTTSPGAKLEVAGQVKITGGTPGTNKVLTSDSVGLASWTALTSIGIGGSGTTNYLPKFTAGTTLGNSVVYETSGNVGIGTTSPSVKLHVVGDGTYSAAFMSGNAGIGTVTPKGLLDVTGSGASVLDSLVLSNSDGTDNVSGAAILFNLSSVDITDTPSAKIWARRNSGAGSGGADLVFNTRTTGNTEGPRMTIQYNGNVGIGTTAPTALLHSYDSAGNTIAIKGTTNASAQTVLLLERINSGAGSLGIDFSSGLTNFRSVNDLTFFYGSNSAGTEAMRIKSGNIGIGTTNPLYKLEVNGSLLATTIGLGATDPAFSFHTTSNGRFDTNLSVGGTTTLAGLSIGTTGTGTTAVFMDGSGNLYKNILGAGAFTAGLGTTYTATNGLTLTGTAFGLGGTLTQNTNIGLSSSVLSFNGSSQSLVLASTGLVGIGGTNPLYALNVGATANFNNLFTSGYVGIALTNPASPIDLLAPETTARTITLRRDHNTVGDGVYAFQVFLKNASNNYASYADQVITINSNTAGAETGQIDFRTAVSGTVAPRLSINGAFTVATGVNGYPATSGTAQNGIFRLQNPSTSNVLDFGNGNVSPFGSWIQSTDNTDLSAKYPLLFNPNAGNVGIGTTNPLYKLHVAGEIFTSTKLGVGATGTAAFNVVGNGNITTSLTVGTSLSVGTTAYTGSLNINKATGIGGSNIVAYLVGTTGFVGYLDTTSWDKSASDDYTSWNLAASLGSAQSITNGNTASILGINGIGTSISATDTLSVGLGGTLTQNTNIGVSSFGLSFLGINSNTQALYIASSGKVGIGTTNPLSELFVENVGSTHSTGLLANTYGDLHIRNTNITGANQGSLITLGSGYSGGATVTMETAAAIKGANDTWGNNGAGNLQFYTAAQGSHSQLYERMRIDSYGNLGIGTTNPLYDLHINGDTLIATRLGVGSTNVLYDLNVGNTANFNTLFASGYVGIGTTSPQNKLHVEASAANPLYVNSGVYNNVANFVSSDDLAIITLSDDDTNSYINAQNGHTSIGGFANLNPANLNINNTSGNVGIATTNPLYDLHVNGDTLIATRLGIGSTNTSYTLNVGGSGLGVGGTVNFSGLAIGTTGAGTTAVFTDGSGNLYKNILGAGAFGNGVGTTYSVTNGLSAITTNVFGLGGTLTQNTNIGVSSFGLNIIGINSNTQALYIASNGNVGIGTTGPQALTHLYKATSGTKTEVLRISNLYGTTNGGASIVFNQSPGTYPNWKTAEMTGFYDTGSWGGGLAFSTHAATGNEADATVEAMRITSAGNVGIGTTNPGVKLEVVGTLGTAPSYPFEGIRTTASSHSAGLGVEGAATYWGAALYQDGVKRFVVDSTGGILVGSNYVNNNAPTNGAIIEGNVGIGTTSPGTKLTVEGTSTGDSSVFTALELSRTGDNADTRTRLSFYDQTHQFATSIDSIRETSATNWALSFRTGSGDSSSGPSDRMRIDSSGNVGIGTTAPLYTLHVSGDALVSTRLGIGSTNVSYTLNVGGSGLGVGGTVNFSGLAIGTTGTGTSGVFVDANGNLYKNKFGTLAFLDSTASTYNWIANASSNQTISGGTTLAFTGTNGLTTTSVGTSKITFGLGGTLSQNTNIGTSSFNLSFYGLGNTPAFTIKSNGTIGIGTTTPKGIFHISNDTYIDDLVVNSTGTTNLVTNPSLETNSTNWTYWINSGTGVAVVSSDTAAFGKNSYKTTLTGSGQLGHSAGCITVSPSTTYTISYWFNATGFGGTSEAFYAREWQSANCGGTSNNIGSIYTNSSTTNGWVRKSATVGTGTSAVSLSLSYYIDNAADIYYVDAVQIEPSSSVSPYVDGSLGPGYSWTGTPHTSSSVRTSGSVFTYQTINSANGIGAVGRNSSPALRIEQDGTGPLASFFTPSSEVLRIDNSGNVGIGTTNPLYDLHVSGDALISTRLGIGSTNTSYTLNVGGSGLGVGGTVNFSGLAIGTTGAGTTAVFATGTGNLYKNILGDLAFRNNSSLGWVAQASANQTIGTGTTLHFDGTNGLTTTSVGTSQITFGLGGTLTQNTNLYTSSYNLSIYGVNSNTQALSLVNGLVGIGVTNPSANYKLDVRGGITSFNSNVGTGATWTTAAIVQLNNPNNAESETAPNRSMRFVQYNTGGAYGAGIAWGMAPEAAGTWKAGSYSTGQYLLSYTGGNLDFQGSNQNAGASNPSFTPGSYLTIASNGNIGVSTPTPLYKLHVSGDALISTRLGIGSTNALYALNVGNTASFNNLFASGSVGIGTSAPNQKLEIKATAAGVPATSGTTQSGIMRLSQGSGAGIIDMGFGGTTGAGWIQPTNSGNLATNYDLWLNPNGGDVGIGTTNPQRLLDISANSTTEVTNLRLTNTAWSANQLNTLEFYSGTPSGTNLVTSAIKSKLYSGGTNGELQLWVNSNSTALQALTIGNSGYVGIGTTRPTYPLEIGTSTSSGSSAKFVGEVQAQKFTDLTNYSQYYLDPANFSPFSSTLSMNQVSMITLNAQYTGVWSSILAGSSAKIQGFTYGLWLGVGSSAVGAGTTITGWDTQGIFINGSGNVGINTTLPRTSFQVNNGLGGTGSFNVASNGNVGIGTTNPLYDLSVIGDALISTRLGIGSTNVLYDLNVGDTSNFNNIFASGYVGFGTTAPTYRLEIVGSGNLLSIGDTAGNTFFDITDTTVTSNLPVNFTSSGDVSIAYDINFNNPTASYIKSSAPLYLQSGEVFSSSDLTLRTFNSGNIVLDIGNSGDLLPTINLTNDLGSSTNRWNEAWIKTVNVGSSTWSLSSPDSSRLSFFNNSSAGGTEAFTIKANGTVGIGTAAPGAKLHIKSSDGYPAMRATNNSNYGFSIGTEPGTTPKLYFGTLTSDTGSVGDKMVLDFTGNVGIGTSSPSQKLDVQGQLNVGVGIGTSQLQIYTDGSGASGRIVSPSAIFLQPNLSTVLAQFGGANPAQAGTDFFLNSSGQLGIGTTSPRYTLEVGGVGQTVTTLLASGSNTSWARIGVGRTNVEGSFAVSSSAGQFMPGSIAGDIIVRNESTANRLLLGTVGVLGIGISNGQTGIGTTNPGTFKLYVNGTLHVESATTEKITNIVWTNPSDARLKDVVGNYSKGLDEILQVQPVQYTYKADNALGINDPGLHTGIIAQQIQPIFPEAVTNYSDGYLRYTADTIIWAMVNSVKTLNSKIEGLDITADGQINIEYNISDSVLASLGYNGAKNEIQNSTYSLTDSLGNTVTRVGQFAKVTSTKITTGLLSATNIITKNLVADRTISKSIVTNSIVPDSEISDTIVVGGTLAVSDLQVTSVSAQNATISGTLYADNIISRQGTIGDLVTDKVSALRAELQNIITASINKTPDATPSAIMAQVPTWATNIGVSQVQIDGDIQLTGNMVIGSKLSVLGDTQLANAFISGTFTAGEIAIKDNFVETTNANLYLQPSGTGTVHILKDTLVIADTGDVTINGNLHVTGNINTPSLIANLIQASDIQVTSITANDVKAQALYVATDSATMVIAQGGFAQLATSSAQINSNATAGNATLPAGKTELVVNNPKVSNTSMVYLTPNGSTQNQVLYVKSKFISPTPSPEATPSSQITDNQSLITNYFTIALDQPLDHDLSVNWWIIN